jgi:fatty-acid desaturase
MLYIMAINLSIGMAYHWLLAHRGYKVRIRQMLPCRLAVQAWLWLV